MGMRSLTNAQLDELIACHNCHTINKKPVMQDKHYAHCANCQGLLYQANKNTLSQGLALSVSALLMLIVVNVFPIVSIEILGETQFLSLFQLVFVLTSQAFYLIAVFAIIFVILMPIVIALLEIWIFSGLLLQTKSTEMPLLLTLLRSLKPWNMSAIFLVSILIALVKLLGYANIDIHEALFSLFIYVVLSLYLIHLTNFNYLWQYAEQHCVK